MKKAKYIHSIISLALLCYTNCTNRAGNEVTLERQKDAGGEESKLSEQQVQQHDQQIRRVTQQIGERAAREAMSRQVRQRDQQIRQYQQQVQQRDQQIISFTQQLEGEKAAREAMSRQYEQELNNLYKEAVQAVHDAVDEKKAKAIEELNDLLTQSQTQEEQKDIIDDIIENALIGLRSYVIAYLRDQVTPIKQEEDQEENNVIYFVGPPSPERTLKRNNQSPPARPLNS